MPNSVQTSFFGPLVSLKTSRSAPSTPPHLHLDSNTTLTVAGLAVLSGTGTLSGTITQSGTLTSTGIIDSNGTLDASGAKFISKTTTASLTSLTLADGEMAIGAVSATSCILYVRSGNTTYRFLAPIAGAVL